MPSGHSPSFRSASAHPSVDPIGRGRSPSRPRHSQDEEHAEDNDHRGRSVHRGRYSWGEHTEHGSYHNRDEPKIAEIGDIRVGDCSLLDLYRMWCGVPDYRMLSRADQGGLHKHRNRGEELHLAPWDNGHPGDRHSAQPDWRRFKSSLFHSHAFSTERRAMSSYIVVGWITLACSFLVMGLLKKYSDKYGNKKVSSDLDESDPVGQAVKQIRDLADNVWWATMVSIFFAAYASLMDTVALYHHARQIEHLANAFRDFYIAKTEQVSGHTDKDLAEKWWNQDRTLAKETRKWSRFRIALNALFMLILASVIVAFAAQLWKKTIRPSYTNIVFKNVTSEVEKKVKVKGKKKKNGKQKYETVLQTVTQEKKVNETIIGTCKDANLEHCGILEELSGSVVASAALHVVWALYSIGLALWAYIENSKESKFSAGTMTKWSPELVLKEVYSKW